MYNNTIKIIIVLFCFSTIITAQEKSVELKKLEFLLGEWKSVSVNQSTGEESTGKSVVKPVIGGKWLQWKFEAQLKDGPLEVLTLINYQNEKKQYAFISFNPFDDVPLIHYGNWINKNTLRLKITHQNETTWVDFNIKESGNFEQVHSKILPSGERIIMGKTNYSKINSVF